MTPDRWQTIKEIFNAVVQRPPEERAGFLADACGNDEAVRSEVASLLAAHAGDESFLAVPAFEMGAELLMNLGGGPSAGDQIGPYKILSELGSGGMGDVFLAQDTRLGRNVALKLLPVEWARDLQRVRRFEQEARTASALNHPNVCVIHEIGKTSDGRQFIAMEYIDGVTLRARLAEKRMTLTETLDVGAQVAWALEAAHAAGVVHRDIKPENIMLRRDGYVKVLDFGIAKLNEISPPQALTEASTLARVHTDPGTRMGTVKYMSPEQLRERPVDERTDIWSLGVVLHEMATGATPFAARTTNETIAAILERQPLSFAAGAEQIPAGFQQIIKKALSKNRQNRYQKVSSLAADLRQLRRQIDDRVAGKGPDRETTSGKQAQDIPLQPTDSVPAAARPGKGRTLFFTTAETIITEIKEHKKVAMFAGFAATFALLFVATNLPGVNTRLRNFFKQQNQQSLPSPQTLKMTPLTHEGNAVCAAISPDGKQVAHAESIDGMQELRLARPDTSGSSVVVPPADVAYGGITFSRDNLYLYFIRKDKSEVSTLYRVALPGSAPIRIKEGVDSPIAFSPQGDRFTFVRLNRAEGEYSLMIAGIDGTGERVIATRRDGNRLSLGGPAWSPDEQSILCPAGWWDNGYHMNLTTFDVSDSSEKTIGTHRWFLIEQAAWLEDGSGLIISARDQPMAPAQLWRISYPQGEVSKITNDPADYLHVSVSGNGEQIVSVQNQQRSQIFVAPEGDATRAKPIRTGTGLSFGLSWTGNGKIVFSAMASSNLNLSLIDSDGSNQMQLTNNAGDNYSPVASPDGRFIVFASNRSGSFNIWRVNADDGSDPRQLTFTDGNFYPSCSADSQWVAYENQSYIRPSVWKVSLEGNEPRQLSDKYARMPVISPDNDFIACRYYLENKSLGIAIIPAAGGPPAKLLPISIKDFQRVQWTANGRALNYVKTENGISNIWRYDLNGGVPRRLTNFTSEKIYTYAWSPDFKQLACERGVDINDVMVWRAQK